MLVRTMFLAPLVLGVMGSHAPAFAEPAERAVAPIGEAGDVAAPPARDVPAPTQRGAPQPDPISQPEPDADARAARRARGALVAGGIALCAAPVAVVFSVFPWLACVSCAALPLCHASGAAVGTAVGGGLAPGPVIAAGLAGGLGALITVAAALVAFEAQPIREAQLSDGSLLLWGVGASALGVGSAALTGALTWAALVDAPP
jgi:hypothetical protein